MSHAKELVWKQPILSLLVCVSGPPRVCQMLGLLAVCLFCVSSANALQAQLDEVPRAGVMHDLVADNKELLLVLPADGVSSEAVPPRLRGMATKEGLEGSLVPGESVENNGEPNSSVADSLFPIPFVWIGCGISILIIGMLVASSLLAHYVCCHALAVRDPTSTSRYRRPPLPPTLFAVKFTIFLLYHQSIRMAKSFAAALNAIHAKRCKPALPLPVEVPKDDWRKHECCGIPIVLIKQEPELTWLQYFPAPQTTATEPEVAGEEVPGGKATLSHQCIFFGEEPPMADSFTCTPGWRC